MKDITEKTGSYIVQPRPIMIVPADSGEGLFATWDTNDYLGEKSRMGFMDGSGQWVIPPMYKSGNPFGEGLAFVTLTEYDGPGGFIDKNNKLILPYKYYVGGLFPRFSEGLFSARDPDHNLEGYIDRTGNWVIEPQFHKAYDFRDGVAVVHINNLTGLISRR